VPLGPSDDPYKHLGRRAPEFRPHFTIGLIYLIVLFFLFALLLILPSLLEVLADVPAGPEQEKIAYEVARQVARPRLYSAAALSVATVLIGGYYKVLPGMRS
jgi:hypothetical protein